MKKPTIYTLILLVYFVSLKSFAITVRGSYTQGNSHITWDTLAPHTGSNTWITAWDSTVTHLEPTAQWLPYGVQNSNSGARFQHIDGTLLTNSPTISVTGVAYHLGTSDRRLISLSNWNSVPGTVSAAAVSSIPFIYMQSSDFDTHFSSIVETNDRTAYTPFIAIAPLINFSETDLISALNSATKTGLFRVILPFNFRYLYQDPNSGFVTQRISNNHQVVIEIEKTNGYVTDVIIDPYDEIPATYHSDTVSGQLDVFGRAVGYLPGGLLKMSVNRSDTFILRSVSDPSITIPLSLDCILACSATEVIVDGVVRNDSIIIDSGGDQTRVPMQFRVSYGKDTYKVLRESLITDHYRGVITLDFEPNY